MLNAKRIWNEIKIIDSNWTIDLNYTNENPWIINTKVDLIKSRIRPHRIKMVHRNKANIVERVGKSCVYFCLFIFSCDAIVQWCPWWTHSIYFYLDSEFFFFCLCYRLSFAQTFPSHLFCSFEYCVRVRVRVRVYLCYCLWTMQFLTIHWENDSEWRRSVNEIFINLPYTLHTQARAYVQYSFRAIFPFTVWFRKI